MNILRKQAYNIIIRVRKTRTYSELTTLIN